MFLKERRDVGGRRLFLHMDYPIIPTSDCCQYFCDVQSFLIRGFEWIYSSVRLSSVSFYRFPLILVVEEGVK